MKKILACGLGLAIAGQPAVAQENNSAGITYDCDTAADHYSELILPAGAAPFRVTGKVRLIQSAPSRNYVPLTRIAISNEPAAPGPSRAAWAGFQYTAFAASRNASPTLLLATSESPDGSSNNSQTIGPPSAEDVAFSLTFDGAEVTAAVDGKERKMPFRAERPVVRIVCSTAEFLYTDLVVRQLD